MRGSAAGEHHLMVDRHGAEHPTGLVRTWGPSPPTSAITAAPTDLVATKRTVKAGDVLTLKLAPSGGEAVRLTPAR